MLRQLLTVLLLLTASAFAAPLDDAIELYRRAQFPEARAAFEKLAAAEQPAPLACYYLGQVLRRVAAPDAALPWLEKAVALAPSDSAALTAYGEVCLDAANRRTSLSLASKGRNALESAIAANPDNLEPREALMQYYLQAPWPLGDRTKALHELDEITRRNPSHGAALGIRLKADAKDFSGAFQLCDDLLAKNPDNYTVLYAYGRTAHLSGQNLERALAHLTKCLALTPPTPASPGHSYVCSYIGTIQEKLGHPAEARAAFQRALALDSTNARATAGLARVK